MSDGADKELVGDQISDLRDQIERATQLVTKSNGTPDLTAVDFVERLLRSQGGSYRLAQLSKFLKNSAPPGIVAECLPIRRWLDANADSFEVVMEHGAYVVNLRPKRTVTSDAAKDSGDTCFGVDDWIYFRCTGEVANVVNGIRRALGQLIDRQIHRGPIGREGTLLVDTICDALVVTERAASTGAARPADAPPVSHQHLHGGRGRGSHEGRGRGGRESHGWRGRGRGGYGTRTEPTPQPPTVPVSNHAAAPVGLYGNPSVATHPTALLPRPRPYDTNGETPYAGPPAQMGNTSTAYNPQYEFTGSNQQGMEQPFATTHPGVQYATPEVPPDYAFAKPTPMSVTPSYAAPAYEASQPSAPYGEQSYAPSDQYDTWQPQLGGPPMAASSQPLHAQQPTPYADAHGGPATHYAPQNAMAHPMQHAPQYQHQHQHHQQQQQATGWPHTVNHQYHGY
eukprot:m.1032509 g.1032509  ORF g.1032509 m.1032509 type:complete len:453 (+) comp24123_c1_seq31:2967-4325(+)